MKLKKKLPRYWLGTRKPTGLGYQPNRGIGDTTFNTLRGISVLPEANAMRLNQLPNALGKLSSATLYPMLMLLNLTPALLTTEAANAFKTAGSLILPTSTKNWAIGTALKEVGKKAPTKAGLNTIGTTAGALGTAWGLYNIGSDIAHAGDTISQGQIANSAATNTITTAGGNTYTERGGIDSKGIMDYEHEMAKSKKIGLTADTMGLGASVGGLAASLGLMGSVGGPLGTAIGAGVGLLAGGVASLLGFGDNEEEVEQMMRDQEDVFAMLNRQNKATALDKDTKAEFYNRAADGKRPVWTPAGLIGKKATARVSNGEVVGNFEEGIATRIPGLKNNKDTKLAALKDGDFVISNKYGLSDYAAATGDYAGALNLLEMLMGMRNSKGYKNGKLPKCGDGTSDWETNWYQHRRRQAYENADTAARMLLSEQNVPLDQYEKIGEEWRQGFYVNPAQFNYLPQVKLMELLDLLYNRPLRNQNENLRIYKDMMDFRKNNMLDPSIHYKLRDFQNWRKQGLFNGTSLQDIDDATLEGYFGGIASNTTKQSLPLNKAKNGKLPGFKFGWDSALSMLPHVMSFMTNLSLYNRAKNADTYAPDTYVDNAEGAKAVNELAQLRYDATPYYREAQRGLNLANWDARRQVGLGMGGRAIAQNANFNAYLNGLAKINATENEANTGYRTAYANALALLGARNQEARINSNIHKYGWQQQANAAKENWMAQYLKNRDTSFLNGVAEWLKQGQYKDSLAAQNRMLNIYEKQAETDRMKVLKGLPDAVINNTPTTPTTIYVPPMLARPTDEDLLSKVYKMAPWRNKPTKKSTSVDPYTNVYNLAAWH